MQCWKEQEPCSEEDWADTAKMFDFEVNQMVANLVQEEIQEPQCVFTKDCEEGEIEQYKKEYEIKTREVQEQMTRVNKMIGWWGYNGISS